MLADDAWMYLAVLAGGTGIFILGGASKGMENCSGPFTSHRVHAKF